MLIGPPRTRRALSFPLQSLAALAVFCLLSAPLLRAQASGTATRRGGISVFAGFVYANPDSGADKDTGSTVGVDFTHFFTYHLSYSFEGRAAYVDGPLVRERTADVGGRFSYAAGRYHPYGDFLVGAGTILFHPAVPRYQDRSTVYSYGGGLNIDLIRNLAFKADVQGTHWNLGQVHKLVLQPTLVTVGLQYHIPFRALIRHHDPDR